MTEPELITLFSNMSVDARAVITMLTQYATASTNVTLTLSNGTTYTLPGIELQRNLFSTDRAEEQLQYVQDFGGAVASQTVTRDVFSTLTGVQTILSSGFKLSHVYNRDVTGKISTIDVVVKDSLDNTLATITKTIQRTGNLYSGII